MMREYAANFPKRYNARRKIDVTTRDEDEMCLLRAVSATQLHLRKYRKTSSDNDRTLVYLYTERKIILIQVNFSVLIKM